MPVQGCLYRDCTSQVKKVKEYHLPAAAIFGFSNNLQIESSGIWLIIKLLAEKLSSIPVANSIHKYSQEYPNLKNEI